ncbi:quinone-interacting membrane-bound oxidoreductase complex subunit QmoC [Desulfurivibrio dismutans]|uniref:quinone-interacting membrane-bound oxidoreductase complex subunit QmoC n=1 Tax=Desulfurivibrio dismutans TaxID=1398908 RepID=UPI0023DBBC1E|nr:quinone-interacting membrane-bound oxidoreductase complex subunit QmoC [Desulfurivibrio alkaliphilus]MDF1613442.1 quinone-interacting membrane-bound oxidoreductase complex subunit QmoC [Desulfurivibrio alkaliphilus]
MSEGMKVQPDLEFIKYLKNAGGDTLKKCYQCATCSVVCPLSGDDKPFPRKEMIWSQWGLKEKLVADPDVMLCHQCGDCTTNCPRGAKPGDVLGAIRAYAYTHYGFPQGLAKLCSQGKNLPIMILIPTLIIGIVWWLSGGMKLPDGDINFGYFFGDAYYVLPVTTLLIQLIFVPTLLFAIYAFYRGISNMWKGMAAQLPATERNFRPSVTQFISEFIWPSVKEIMTHKRFNECGTNRNRVTGHMPLVFAFIALLAVTAYAMIRKDVFGLFIEGLHVPLTFADPFKILANVAGIALIVGVGILWVNRSRTERENNTTPTFYDWYPIGIVMAVGVTGMAAQIFRLGDVAVMAYLLYFMHLVSVFMLFLYTPYTKLAHMFYRTFAMAFEKYRASGYVQKQD